MGRLNTEEWHAQAIRDIARLDKIVKEELMPASSQALSTAPAEGKWSVLQCIEHLNRTSDHYLPELEKALKIAKEAGDAQASEFKTGWIGRKGVKGLKPRGEHIPRPMRTFKGMDPGLDQKISDDGLNTFLKRHDVLRQLLDVALKHDPGKRKITSLVKLIKFRVGDAVDFLIAHEERHILQAQRALSETSGS